MKGLGLVASGQGSRVWGKGCIGFVVYFFFRAVVRLLKLFRV